MKKLMLYTFMIFLILISFIGCTKNNSKDETNVTVDEIFDKLKDESELKSPITEDLKDTETAERYGISTDDIEGGKVYYSSDETKSDKILIAKASDETALEKVEKAFSAEIIGLTNTWENDEQENKKVEEHVLKTHGNFVVLILSENSKKLEDIFDSFFNN